MLLKSPRLDALKVEIAPEFHHGAASPGAGGNRWRRGSHSRQAGNMLLQSLDPAP